MKIKQLLWCLFPRFLAEFVALSAGYIVVLLRPGAECKVEDMVRGAILSRRYATRKFSLGRHCIIENPSRVVLGKNVKIRAGTQLVPGTRGCIEIGNHSHISRNSVFAGGGDIRIGSHTKISSGVTVYSVTYDRSNGQRLRDAKAVFLPVCIGDDVHIGANATILPGVTIHNNAVIGAGAVVTKDVQKDTIVVGSPARDIHTKAV